MDSNRSVASDKEAEASSPGHLNGYNLIGQGKDQGKHTRPLPALSSSVAS